jgi:hypothetical protein
MYTRFNKITLMLPLGLLAAVGLINWAIDPYQIYRTIHFAGINQVKPEMGNHLRLAKASIVEDLKPSAIILGDSRTERGIDPDHPGWLDHSQPRYNLALTAISTYESLRYFQHANAVHPLKQVVIGLDITNFVVPELKNPEFNEDRLAVKPDGEHATEPSTLIMQTLKDRGATLLSLDSLFSSMKTVAEQNDPTSADHQANGLNVMNRSSDAVIQKKGHRFAFQLKNREYLSNYLAQGLSFYLPGTHESPTLHYFQILVATCRRDHIDLRLYIQPNHAYLLETFKIKGLWPTMDQWKRELVSILAEDAAAHPKEKPFPLWDFSGYNTITTEAIPMRGDTTTKMKWYWEGSHYKKELGDQILDRIFNYQSATRKVSQDFGVLLTPNNLETHLVNIRQKQQVYAQTHPGEIAEIEIFDNESRVASASKNSKFAAK